MVSRMVVLRHEGRDPAFEIAGQVIVLKQDAVLERLMPPLDLALGLRVIRRADAKHAERSGCRTSGDRLMHQPGLEFRIGAIAAMIPFDP